jgi:adenosylhomocysteine nucleosidase
MLVFGETVVFGGMLRGEPCIAVLTAMQSESRSVANHLHHKKNIEVNGVSYTIGQYAGKNIVLASTGIGKINAASVTTATIITFHPKAILFAGIAGKLDKSLKTGDVIIGKSLYQVEHLTAHKPDPDFINPQTKKPNSFLMFSDPNLVILAKHVAKTNKFGAKVIEGRIATTDIFPPDKYSSQMAVDSKSIAIEMEGFSALAVSQLHHVPCLVVRVISDDNTVVFNKNYNKHKYAIPLINEQLAESNMAAFVAMIIEQYNL